MAETGSPRKRQFHLLVWGASGFTGRKCCEYLARQYGSPSAGMDFAIAGRSEAKLEEVEKQILETARQCNKLHEKMVPKLVASTDDYASIVAMVRQTRAVVAVAGPYTHLGEAVLRACAEEGTHYVDATAELPWVTRMRAAYDATARTSRAKIVPCMGGVEFGPTEAALVHLGEICAAQRCDPQSVTILMKTKLNGISGGTLRTLCDPEIFRGMASRDPYAFCSYRPAEAIRAANHLRPAAGRAPPAAAATFKYRTPSAVAGLFSKYIRWSNEVSDFSIGRNVVVRVHGGAHSIFQMLLACLMILFLPLAGLLRFVPEKLLPDPGTATSKKAVHDEGTYGVTLATVAEVADRSSGEIKTIGFETRSLYEPYYLTGIYLVETAAAMAMDETPEVFGVRSGHSAVGPALLKRLQPLGIVNADSK